MRPPSEEYLRIHRGDEKLCVSCNVWKSLTDYFNDNRNRDGVRRFCKACESAKNGRWHIDNAEKVKQNAHEYNNREDIKKRRLEWEREDRRKNPEKYKQRDSTKSKRAYAKNPEKFKARSRENRLKDPVKTAMERNEEYKRRKDRHPEKVKEATRKAYLKGGKERLRVHRHKRRAIARALPANFEQKHIDAAHQYFNHTCAYCGQGPAPTDHYPVLHLDHFIPLTSPRCPGTIPSNMLPACQSCNFSKNDSDPIEWIVSHFSEEEGGRVLAGIELYFTGLKHVE